MKMNRYTATIDTVFELWLAEDKEDGKFQYCEEYGNVADALSARDELLRQLAFAYPKGDSELTAHVVQAVTQRQVVSS